jgi:hypothetical protein
VDIEAQDELPVDEAPAVDEGMAELAGDEDFPGWAGELSGKEDFPGWDGLNRPRHGEGGTDGVKA